MEQQKICQFHSEQIVFKIMTLWRKQASIWLCHSEVDTSDILLCNSVTSVKVLSYNVLYKMCSWNTTPSKVILEGSVDRVKFFSFN